MQVPIQLLPGEGEECGGMQQPRTEPSMVEMFEELAQIAVIKVAKYLVDNNIKNIYFITLYRLTAARSATSTPRRRASSACPTTSATR